MKYRIGSLLCLCVLAAALAAEEPANSLSVASKKMVVRMDTWSGMVVDIGKTTYGIEGFGIEPDFFNLLSSTPEGKIFMKDTNGSIIAGTIVDTVCAAGGGVLLGLSTADGQSSSQKLALIGGGLASLFVGGLIQSVLLTGAQNDILKSVDAYNTSLLIAK